MTEPDGFFAIADPNRRFILEELRRGPKTVGDLAAQMPVSRPAVSQHLRLLLDSGLVTAKKDGTKRLYALKPGSFERLNLWLDQFWQV